MFTFFCAKSKSTGAKPSKKKECFNPFMTEADII